MTSLPYCLTLLLPPSQCSIINNNLNQSSLHPFFSSSWSYSTFNNLCTLNVISWHWFCGWLCPSTFHRLGPLSIAAHSTCDAIFLWWTNNTKRTAYKHTDSAGVCGNQNLAAAHPTPYAAFTSWQNVGHRGTKYSKITAATKTGIATRKESPKYITTTKCYKLYCKTNISWITKCKENSGVSVTGEKYVVTISALYYSCTFLPTLAQVIGILPYCLRRYSFIPLACAECNDSLLFSGASSISICCVLFPATHLHQLFFHPLSPHLAIYFLVYLSILLFPNPRIILFWEFKNVHDHQIQLHTKYSWTSNTQSSVTVENQTVCDLRSNRLRYRYEVMTHPVQSLNCVELICLGMSNQHFTSIINHNLVQWLILSLSSQRDILEVGDPSLYIKIP